jgi:ribosomal protein S18 acetylase RimI-like enzyme
MKTSCEETGRITPVAESDLDALAELAREIWYLHYPGIITVSQIDYMLAQRYHPSVIAAQIESGETWWDKLLVGSVLAGFACYEPGSRPDSVKLDKLYVHPRVQGCGFGYKLVQHGEKTSAERGYVQLYLQVNKGNAASIAFYRRAGFNVTEEITLDIGEGYFMEDFVMAKSIGAERA